MYLNSITPWFSYTLIKSDLGSVAPWFNHTLVCLGFITTEFNQAVVHLSSVKAWFNRTLFLSQDGAITPLISFAFKLREDRLHTVENELPPRYVICSNIKLGAQECTESVNFIMQQQPQFMAVGDNMDEKTEVNNHLTDFVVLIIAISSLG